MKTLVLLCKDVIDHGHCSTSVWKTGDDRATLQLYLLEPEGKPTKGDLLEVDIATGEEELRSVATIASRVGPTTPHDDMVICPACTSQFIAVPVSVQRALHAYENAPAPAPVDPFPTLFPPDHEPQPEFPGYQATLRQDLANVMGMTPPDTTVVHSDAPPVDNAHVAEGCEQFEDPTTTHEAVSSLDTPAQILGAGAEQPQSD